jgi:uncharacterized protein YfaS (alpha-2-macroglobulin family)
MLLLVVIACSDQQANVTPATVIRDDNNPWLQILNSHSSGQLSRFAPINIQFNQDLPKQLPDNFLTFEPNIQGQGGQVNSRLYRFVPTQPLASGQQYSAALSASAVALTQAGSDDFVFNFNVIEQAFEIKMDGLQVIKDGTMQVQGELNTADISNPEEVQTLISANYLGRDQSVKWQALKSGKSHHFIIDGIKRDDNLNSLLVSWSGMAIGVEEQGSRSFDVPAVGQFVVSSVVAIQGSGQTIEINFSEPLQSKQDLSGLIQVSKGSVKSKIQGSKITLYPSSTLSGPLDISIDKSIKNSTGFALGKAVNKTLNFLSKKPAVHFVGKGHILPVSDQLSVPFEAVNVDSVQVTAFQVFDGNMPQFFQENELSDDYRIQRVGRYLWRKTVQLKSPVADTWNRFNLDVKDLVINNPGSLFRFELSINRSNSILTCSESDEKIDVVKEKPFENYEALNQVESSGWDGIESYYGAPQADWRDRSNPCKDAYYQMDGKVNDERNFIASNIGLIAKYGEDKKLIVVATQLSNGQPLADAEIKVVNFQNKEIASGDTSGNGFSEFKLTSEPFLLIAKSDSDMGYLKVNKAQAISTSHFNVGGVTVKDGVKAQIYTERGVWRPGDDIFITVVIEDKTKMIPDAHPLMLELFNPKNQRVEVQVNAKPVGGFYTFSLKTKEDDQTGNWKVVASLGGLKFSKDIKIEMVKPNHLKMKLDLKSDDVRAYKVNKYSSQAKLEGEFFSQWLHGAKASGLKADLSLRMSAKKTRFVTYNDFTFDDPAKSFNGYPQELASFNLDDEGAADVNAKINISTLPPGKLRGTLTSRVYEPSGDFSISKQQLDIHPYQQYVGMQMPKGDAARGMLLTDQTQKVDLLVVDADGKPLMGTQSVELTLYKLSWKWWWDSNDDQLANYVSRYSSKHLAQENITVMDGQGQWEFEVKYPDWGRYMIRACDKKGMHCTGQVFYMDWPGWAGRDQSKKGMGANTLTLSSDKEAYIVGDKAIVSLPESQTGRALVSIENGSKVIDYFWVPLQQTGSQLEIPITKEMTPNAYVSVSVIQPHANKTNDEPIRLMGVLPLTVTDPDTHLKPVITTVPEIEPESTLEVEVSELNGRAFNYTLAVVDEGLLGLTQFRTPNLHKGFYKKESLGIKTWDLFDQVVGAYGAQIEKLLAIGGDGSLGDKEKDSENRRFPPVVKFIGPFHLEKGQSTKHSIEIPQYLGAVRVMLVAGENAAYGQAEKEVLVRKPLNLLATLPRVLGKDETLQMPVTIFTTEDNIKTVNISVNADEKIEVLKGQLTVDFKKAGEHIVFVPMRAKNLGISQVEVLAEAGNYRASQKINIPIRAQSQMRKRYKSIKIDAKQNWSDVAELFGMPGTQKVSLEMSMMPPMNLQNRLDYLLGFPHGCVEQTTSKALPQLFLPELTNLSEAQLLESQNNVAAAIDKLSRYQSVGGGFSYWPGLADIHDWASSYAGHFLLIAKDHGYDVEQKMLNSWLANQTRTARAWTTGMQKEQAYRLFTLALSGNGEIGAMNRFRQRAGLDNLSRWLLAASYQLAGQQDAAQALAKSASTEMAQYNIVDNSFGSTLRDEAMMLMSLLVLGDAEQAALLADKVSSALVDRKQYYSTQTTAFSLLAMSMYGKAGQQGESKARVNWQGNEQALILNKAINAFPLLVSNQQDNIEINNEGEVPLYVQVKSEGVAELGEEQAYASELELKVEYFNNDNQAINIANVSQGQDIKVMVSVLNKSIYKLDYLALTLPVASGFEIRTSTDDVSHNGLFDYQDVRDDRVFTYLKLAIGESKTFEYRLNATYQGRYYQPAVSIGDMYDEKRAARNTGHWIEIVR